MDIYQGVDNDYDRAMAFLNILESYATGGTRHDSKFIELRGYFYQSTKYKAYMPKWMNSIFTLDAFWNFIKHKFAHYHERRGFLQQEFAELINHCNDVNSILDSQADTIIQFNSDGITSQWKTMLDRIENDSAGAITLSKTLIESVCKHILDDYSIAHTANDDISVLYKKTAEALNLSAEQHDSDIIKKILGSCSGIVKGITEFRNQYSDSHGTSKNHIDPYKRHARLCANASGTLCLFLIETFNFRKKQGE